MIEKDDSLEQNNNPQLDVEKSFEALKPSIEKYLKEAADTEYGKSIALDKVKISDYQLWNELIPKLTVEGYSTPTQYVRSDSDHTIEDMKILYSGGTSGAPKETYYSPENSGIRLNTELEDLIKETSFLFLSEKKDTVSFGLLKTWAEQSGVSNAEYGGFENLEEFLKYCGESKGNVYLTLQVSSARTLFAQLAEALQTNPGMIEDIVSLDNLMIDLVAEPVKIQELERWHKTLESLFGVKPVIAVPYAATEHKLIGLYHYSPGDTEIIYKVIDGILVETTNPDSGKPVNGFGNLVVTDTNKSFGSLYPRYDTGDQAEVIYDDDGVTYIGEVERDPSKNQINLRGSKLYTHVFHEALQERLGPDVPVRTQFQLVEAPDHSSSTLVIEIGGSNLGVEQIEQIRTEVAGFMGETDGYKFLWQGGKEEILGERYRAQGVVIDIRYMSNLSWDNPKSFRRLPNTDYERFGEARLKTEMDNFLSSVPRAADNLESYSKETLLNLRRSLVAIIENDSFSEVNSVFYESEEWRNFRDICREFNYRFEVEDEKQLSKLALDGKLEEALGVLGATRDQARSEIEDLGLDISDRVCFVGNGTLPISVIEYARLGMTSVTGVDTDSEAINIARRVVNNNSINNVSFNHADGSDLDFTQYDVVMLAAMVDGKEEIIEKIRQQTDVPILVRVPKNVRAEILYSPCRKDPKKVIQYSNNVLQGNIY